MNFIMFGYFNFYNIRSCKWEDMFYFYFIRNFFNGESFGCFFFIDLDDIFMEVLDFFFFIFNNFVIYNDVVIRVKSWKFFFGCYLFVNKFNCVYDFINFFNY